MQHKNGITLNKPVAMVRWGDATYSSLAYHDESKDYEPMETISVGILVEYDDQKALLYTDFFDDGDFRNRVLIPTDMIRDIWILDIQ